MINIDNPEEKVNALTKLADLIGKKTLVMWCILTTFTTGYLFVDVRTITQDRINEIKESNERLVGEIKGIKIMTEQNKKSINSTIPKLDTTINNVNKTLENINNNK